MRSIRSVAHEAISAASRGMRPRSPEATRDLLYAVIAVGAFGFCLATIVVIFTLAPG